MIFSHLFRASERARVFAPHLEKRIVAVSFQTVGELWYGAIKADWPGRKRQQLDERIRQHVVLACDEATVRAWAELRAEAEAQGLPKQSTDLWIAATARRHDLPLLTEDAGFFQGLRIRVVRAQDDPAPPATSRR